eukprot:3808955-Alexandrium_andersonii.AAC.1
MPSVFGQPHSYSNTRTSALQLASSARVQLCLRGRPRPPPRTSPPENASGENEALLKGSGGSADPRGEQGGGAQETAPNRSKQVAALPYIC